MILIPNDLLQQLRILAGDPAELDNLPAPIWEQQSVDFLQEFSRKLMPLAIEENLSDVVALAFWLRKSNIEKLKRNYLATTNENKKSKPEDWCGQMECGNLRVGLGLVFHICPSNVPVNFGFSLAFALLAGNSSALRLPSKPSESCDLIVKVINALLLTDSFKAMQRRILLIRYERNDAINGFFLGKADGRVVWGGDATVRHMRKFEVPTRSREIAFADRYSISVLGAQAIVNLDTVLIKKLVQDLFNDMILMNQAACSSPQLICWFGNSLQIASAKERIWPMLASLMIDKRVLSPLGQMNKLVDACNYAMDISEISNVQISQGVLTCIQLDKLLTNQDQIRAFNGTAIQVSLVNLKDLAPIIDERYQTITYFGINEKDLAEMLLTYRLRGVDRIVPVGQAIGMGVLWDGYNLISSLSRVIEVK